MIKRIMKKLAKKPTKKAPKRKMEHKPKEKTIASHKGNQRKTLTAEGWRRLMMGKGKK